MNINQLSYHHIKVFLAVYRHRSASVAGCELGLTNSAISRALSNLRAMFDDDLFIRTAAGFVPTERAKGLAETLETVVGGLRSIEKQYLSFIPSESEGCFEIRVYDEFSFAVQEVIDNRILKKSAEPALQRPDSYGKLRARTRQRQRGFCGCVRGF